MTDPSKALKETRALFHQATFPHKYPPRPEQMSAQELEDWQNRQEEISQSFPNL